VFFKINRFSPHPDLLLLVVTASGDMNPNHISVQSTQKGF
jgi:hypothetical protein